MEFESIVDSQCSLIVILLVYVVRKPIIVELGTLVVQVRNDCCNVVYSGPK